MLRLGSVVLGVDDVERGVTFWSGALGYEVIRFPDADGFVILRHPSGEGTRLAIQTSGTPAEVHPRLHVASRLQVSLLVRRKSARSFL